MQELKFLDNKILDNDALKYIISDNVLREKWFYIFRDLIREKDYGNSV